MAKKTAWVTDAQELEDDKDVLREQSILLQTEAVQDFLSDDNLPSHALVAPKGFGKTFVLKVKRIRMQEAGYDCLPHGIIVDRSLAPAPVLSADTTQLLSTSGAWESLWLIAFVIPALKASATQTHTEELAQEVELPALNAILNSPDMQSPFEVMGELLRLSRRDIFYVIDAANVLFSRFRRIKSSHAVFVDNIDEYVDSYLTRTVTGELDLETARLIWYGAQIGAWLAIRRLHGGNPKIRIFISLRKEAYHYAQRTEPQFANIRSFSSELKYEKSELIKIIELNIRAGLDPKGSRKSGEDLLRAFIGDAGLVIINAGNGSVERILDYWLRHCVGRPRDVVEIGAKIDELSADRLSATQIRSAVNAAAADVVQDLFTESRFHLPTLDGDIIAGIFPSNVLTRAEVEEVSRRYELERAARLPGSAPEQHIFCILYALGLIGIVVEDKDERGSYYQRFPVLGQYPLGVHQVLPNAERYLVHPALADYISTRNTTYVRQLHRFNIVGAGRPWREPDDYVFVLVGDIEGYRENVMNVAGTEQAFRRFWEPVVKRAKRDLAYTVANDGDKIVLADGSPVRLLNAASSIAKQLRGSAFKLRVRFGGHSGFWRLADGGERDGSSIIGVAARLEPLSAPGQVAVSEKFVRALEGFDNAQLRNSFRPDPDITVISKPTEEREQHRLYRRELFARA